MSSALMETTPVGRRPLDINAHMHPLGRPLEMGEGDDVEAQEDERLMREEEEGEPTTALLLPRLASYNVG
jgi:hypothetical protein